MKASTSTVVRVVLLIISLANMALATLGIVPEEIVGNETAYQIGSLIVTAVISIINAWKNNSFTEEAIEADKYLEELKSGTAKIGDKTN